MKHPSRLILELLAAGPMHTPGLCRACDRDYTATVPIMTSLKREGYIEIVGKAADYGFTDVASTAPVYGRTKKPVPVLSPSCAPKPLQVPEPFPPLRRSRGKTNSGSGVIAGTITIGRGYRWGSRA